LHGGCMAVLKETHHPHLLRQPSMSTFCVGRPYARPNWFAPGGP
jgi:hypothetical protein